MAAILPHDVFSDVQCRALRRVFSNTFETWVPHLAYAVRVYQHPQHRHRETYQERARRHEDAIDRLERQCHRVLTTLKKSESLAREARSWDAIRGREIRVKQGDYDDPLPAPHRAGSDLEVACSLYELAMPPWACGEQAQAAIEHLLQDLHIWRTLAHAFAQRPRGRQNTERRRLNVWVGTVLTRAGIPLTTQARGGRLAVAVRVVDQAAGLRVPKDLFRELQYVCRRLQVVPKRQRHASRDIAARNRA